MRDRKVVYEISIINRGKKANMVLFVILLSYFMILLDNSIIYTSTVKLTEDLGLSRAMLSWVSNAYGLTFGGLLLLCGRLGDIVGRKQIFSAGLVIFAIGSLLVGVSQSGAFIIGARAFQGIGSAILAPATLALLMDNYTGQARTRAIAAYGATAGIGASVGLVIGGMFASLLTWRFGFYMNVPIAVLMLILTRKYVDNRQLPKRGTLDYTGSITSVVGMTALVYSIVGEAYSLCAFAAAVILLSLFVWHESKTKDPIIPLHIFNDRTRSGAYIARFLYLGAMVGLWFLLPQMLQRILGYTPLLTSFAFFPMTLVIFFTSMQLSKLSRRFGNTELIVAGLCFSLSGLILLAFLGTTAGYPAGVAMPMVLLGVGQGLAISPLTVAGVSRMAQEYAGAAAGIVNTAHQMGGSVGLSVIVAATGSISNPDAVFRSEMLIVSGLTAAALLAVLLLVMPRKSKREVADSII